jgi:hypothetical protein
MVKAKTPVVVLLALGLAMGVAFVGCSKKEKPAPKAAATATAAQVTEVEKLVDDTKRYAESLKAQPTGDRVSAEQISKLTSGLDRLLRHMEERAQASQQGGDVAKPEAQVAEDLKQLQEVQSMLPASTGEQGTPPAAGQEKSSLDRISENLAKITQIAQQGKELVAIVRPPKGQPNASGSSEGGSSEGTPPADGTRASESLQSSTASSSPTPAASEPSSGASSAAAPGMTAQAGAQSAPVTTGYTTVSVQAYPSPSGRLQVKVNGLLAGVYDGHINTTLDPLLKPGAINTITFIFSGPEGTVDLAVKAVGSDQWIPILMFRSSKEKLEDSFQVPFVGKTK